MNRGGCRDGIAVRLTHNQAVIWKLEVPKVTKVNDFVSIFKMKERSDTSTLGTLTHFSHLKLSILTLIDGTKSRQTLFQGFCHEFADLAAEPGRIFNFSAFAHKGQIIKQEAVIF